MREIAQPSELLLAPAPCSSDCSDAFFPRLGNRAQPPFIPLEDFKGHLVIRFRFGNLDGAVLGWEFEHGAGVRRCVSRDGAPVLSKVIFRGEGRGLGPAHLDAHGLLGSATNCEEQEEKDRSERGCFHGLMTNGLRGQPLLSTPPGWPLSGFGNLVSKRT